MSNALLQQIANPYVPKVNEAFNRGRENLRQDRSRNALGRVLGGDKNAMPELLQADPQQGFEVKKYLSQLDEQSRKVLAQNTEMATRELIGVSQIQDPQQKLSAWQQALQRHKGMGLDTSSYEGLDPDQGMNVAASRILPIAELLKQSQAGPVEVSPGATMYDPRTNKALFTAPNKPDTTASRLVPMPDPNSPSGFSFGVPKPGDAAAPPRSTPRLPPAIQKAEDEDLEAINLSTGIDKDLGSLLAQIQGGGIELGPIDNTISGIRNWAGQSNEKSRNFASLKASLEKLRNDSLRLNKGVQTEGDAVRAWNEILASINDAPLVMQRLGEVQLINQRAVELRQKLIDNRRRSYGSQAPDASQFEATVPTVGANKPQQQAPAAIKFLGFE